MPPDCRHDDAGSGEGIPQRTNEIQGLPHDYDLRLDKGLYGRVGPEPRGVPQTHRDA